MLTLSVPFFQSRDTPDIFIYDTDTQEDIDRRIRCLGSLFPSFVILPSAFDLDKFLRNPSESPILDLGRVFDEVLDDYNTKLAEMPALFRAARSVYDLYLADFLEHWVLFWVYKNSDPNMAHMDQFNLLHVKESMTKAFLSEFGAPLRYRESPVRMNRQEFLSRLDMEWYRARLKDAEHGKDDDNEKNNEAVERGEDFEKIEPLSTSPFDEMGKIVLFEIHSTEISTGMLFDRLVLTGDLCVARYKGFYKISTLVPLETTELDEKVPDFYSLCLFNRAGNLTVYLANTTRGVRGQCVLSAESELQNLEDLWGLLQLDIDQLKPVREESAGLMIEFYIENPKPPAVSSVQWAAIQAPIFADLCLNDPMFSHFFSVNDTDKISRNNHSLYIYFFSPLRNRGASRTAKDIFVGGWNRLSSRFGDLTAILTPVQLKAGDFRIHVKITRSLDRDIVDNFHYILTRLVQLYNREYAKRLALFRKMVDYKPIYIPPSVITYVGSSLPDVDSRLFPSNAYYRKCQRSKVPKIISQTEAEAIADPRLKLLFPPVPIKGIRPRWFKCHDKPANDNLVYRFPGLAPLRGVEHPFGVAPCCFAEDHTKKNTETINRIVAGAETTAHGPDPIIYKTRNAYRLKTDKIMDKIGQLGELPLEIQRLLEKVQPRAEYSRIGMPDRWENASVLACCEYVYGVAHDQSLFRTQSVLRRLLLESNLSVGLQENVDIGVEGLSEILRDEEAHIDPARFQKILEEFYRVQILVITRDRSHRAGFLRPLFAETFRWSWRPQRPLVILYQHFGGETNAMYMKGPPRCELIGYTLKGSDDLRLSFPMNQKMARLLELVYSGFRGDAFNTPVVLEPSTLQDMLMAQRLDGLGKARVVYFTESLYPAVLTTPASPFNVPNRSSAPVPIPGLRNVLSLLRTIKAEIQHAQKFGVYLFLHVPSMLRPLIFVARQEASTTVGAELRNIEIMEEEPEFLRLLLPERVSIMSRMMWTQRLVEILKDYVVILLARFLQQEKALLTNKSIPEIIDSFLDARVVFLAEYPTPDPSEVSPLVDKNPSFFNEEGQLRLPSNTAKKMHYFLNWYMMVRADEMAPMAEFRELPSFYQFVDDFRPHRGQLIQLTLRHTEPQQHNPYETVPLRQIIPFKDQKYYYNPEETPTPVPYILLCFPDKKRALKSASLYFKTKVVLSADEFEKQEHAPTPESEPLTGYFEKVFDADPNIWRTVGRPGKKMACGVFRLEEKGVILLLPFL